MAANARIWGYAESPLIDGDKVVITPGGAAGSIVALNKKTGALLWRSKGFTDAPHYSSLIIAEHRRRAAIHPTDRRKRRGRRRRGRQGALARAAPGQDGSHPDADLQRWLGLCDLGLRRGCNLFKISRAGGKFTAEEVYANKVMANHHGGVIKVGDFVYGYSEGKGWTCQDFKSGAAKWQEKENSAKARSLYADGHLYLRAEDKGTMALIEASPDGYKEHGRFEQPNRSKKKAWPHPVISDGKLYLRDQDVLLCYDVRAR